jgi:hypothetical protein
VAKLGTVTAAIAATARRIGELVLAEQARQIPNRCRHVERQRVLQSGVPPPPEALDPAEILEPKEHVCRVGSLRQRLALG